ncbi:MAG: PQQ-dependent sugar dehydrogenase [Microvirga sp.]
MAMPTRTLIVGNDGANVLQGGAGAELIYGFDPNGPQATTNAIAATRVAAGLAEPVFATAPPGDVGRLFIVEKGGRIEILDLATGATLAAPFLDITSEVNPAGEQGLLGLAFHPDYAANGLFYVYLSTPSGDTEVRRYQVSAGDPNHADAATAQHVSAFDYPATSANHRAGWIGFGPDDMLYVATGDGGIDPGNAQRLDTPLGKILRLDIDADAFPADPDRNYAVPADNPATIDGIAGSAAGTGFYAAGLRNPFRDSFDRGVGDLFIGNVGQASFEEINLGRAGANYGWPATEGFFDQAAFPSFTQPIQCARQRRLGHRRLRLPRRERGPARAVLLRRFRHRPGVDAALQRQRLDSDRAHRPDQPGFRADQQPLLLRRGCARQPLPRRFRRRRLPPDAAGRLGRPGRRPARRRRRRHGLRRLGRRPRLRRGRPRRARRRAGRRSP